MCLSTVLLVVDPGTAAGFAVCALTSEPGYVIYSACGSFWVPMIIMMMSVMMTMVMMFIMMMFYARIYRTASRASAAVRRGFIAAADVNASSRSLGQKQSPLLPSSSENCIALRVHRDAADSIQFEFHVWNGSVHSFGLCSEGAPGWRSAFGAFFREQYQLQRRESLATARQRPLYRGMCYFQRLGIGSS